MPTQRRIFEIIITMFFFLMLSAIATPVQVQVVDANDGHLLSGAEVQCFKDLKSQELVKQTTNTKGFATLDCGNGKQNIIIFHPNYGKKVLPYEIVGRDISMRIRMESAQMMIVED